MMMLRGVALSMLLLPFLSAASFVSAQSAGNPAAPDYAKERAERAADLTEPYGWFSLVALNWIKPGVNTVGSAADDSIALPSGPAHLMTLEAQDGKVTLRAADASLRVKGTHPQAGMIVAADEDDGSAMSSGQLRAWAIDRGGQRYLRVKDPDAPARKHFHGLRWYLAAPQNRVEARWVPGETSLTVVNKLGQKTPVTVPGHVEFEWQGKTEKLTPMNADKDGLFFVFLDATAHTTTDGGGRFLSADAPSNGLDKPGRVILDFNEAANPPCAYSPYATCPLASPENRLKVALEAGEKRYED